MLELQLLGFEFQLHFLDLVIHHGIEVEGLPDIRLRERGIDLSNLELLINENYLNRLGHNAYG